MVDIAPPARAALAVAPSIPVARLLLWRGVALAFAASCATLVLELIAARMLAPFIGASLYTWTSIIGVVLLGVSVGNWLGGKLADRRPTTGTLGELFLLGGLLSLAILGLVALFGDGAIFRPLPLLARIFLLTSLLFLAPSLVLGMVTPVAIRISLPDVRRTGRVVGLIYAAGTAGSLVGNFLTGFVLTAHFTVNAIVVSVGVALVLVGLALRFGPGASQPRGSLSQHPSSAAEDSSVAVPDGWSGESAGWSAIRRLDLRGNVTLASAVVIVSSFCTMAIELAASRILAPGLGLSLYSWTGIIGVVLAGIALGNYLGGRIADRWPRQEVLGISLFVGGLVSLSILVASGLYAADWDPAGWLGERIGADLSAFRLMAKIVAVTAAIFFLPVVVLGTISPQVIRLAVTDLRQAGRVSGKIYAWSTFGAIVGTFATGWWLISALGVNVLVFAMGLILLVLGLVVGRFWARPAVLGALVVLSVGSVVFLQARDFLASACTRETNYFCIKVYDTTHAGNPVRALVLDHLIHSYVKIGDPSYLGYEHEYVQAEVTRFAMEQTGSEAVLVIGGGGYTYPRWVEWALPQASVEVVEIDPGVTEVVYDQLALPRETAIVSHNLDGRQFVHELAPQGHYAVVVQDAVNDLSVPYHIMTKEYNDQVKALLAPRGAYLLTVIDLYADGQLLRSAVRTMMETFPQVQLLSATRSWDSSGASVWVVAGSDQGIDLEQMRAYFETQGLRGMRTQMLDPERLRTYARDGVVLTDQFAPVDNLIAPLFTRRG